jgi:BMFP domain-containing protein YqiC
MVKSDKLDEIVQQFSSLLPDDLRRTGQDVKKNLKAAMSSTLSRMELVTREEFDVQAELLARTRALLQELEERVARLENQLNQERNK